MKKKRVNPKNKCTTDGCRKPREKYRKICSSCKREKYRQDHPHEFYYNAFKQNAKRRGKEFTITLEEFKKFCYETNILQGRGRTRTALHIDRIDDNKGYSYDNIRPLSCSENVKKQREREKVLRYDWQSKQGSYKEVQVQLFDDLPF